MRATLRALAVFAVAAAFVLVPSPAFAKSFAIPNFDVVANLKADGSMDVVETIEYNFDGSFSHGTRPIPSGDYYTITDMKVDDVTNGADQPLSISGAPYNLSWSFSSDSEPRTFKVSYSVLNAVKVGPDVAELYWKWMGTDHGDIQNMHVSLTVPTDQDVRAWAHGPLNGIVSVNKNNILLDVAPLPSGKFIESRVTMPSGAFTVAPSGEPRLANVLKQEQQWASDANMQRFGSKPKSSAPRIFFTILSGLAIIITWVWFFFAWRRWGNDPPRPSDVGKYFQEPPDVAPAIVATTLEFGSVPSAAIPATLVDLAQRGFIKIEEIPRPQGMIQHFFSDENWRFTRVRSNDGTLSDFESTLFDYIFEEADTTTQHEVAKRSKDKPASAKSFMSSFESAVQQQVYGTYVTKAGGFAWGAHIAICIAAVVLGVFAIVNSAIAIGIVLAISSVILLFMGKTLKCRTPLGARKSAEWQGLRNFLHDFTHFQQEAPIGHLILWERYLVYGVALGVAKELCQGLAERAPQISNDPGFATWYVTTGGMSGFGNFTAMSGSFASAVSPPSSGSGGGGGFSGGGGGGGGGGGVGAS